MSGRINPVKPMGIAVGVLSAVVVCGCGGTREAPVESASPGRETPHVAAAGTRAAGKYLVLIAGCNDCHTPGYTQSSGRVPESQWLTGVPVGFRGPWGTTYASNLRLYVAPMSESDWLKVMRQRDSKPPMPWDSLHAMSDADLSAIYQFIQSLGKAGPQTPQDVPPDQEPQTPYIPFAPPSPPTTAGGK